MLPRYYHRRDDLRTKGRRWEERWREERWGEENWRPESSSTLADYRTKIFKYSKISSPPATGRGAKENRTLDGVKKRVPLTVWAHFLSGDVSRCTKWDHYRWTKWEHHSLYEPLFSFPQMYMTIFFSTDNECSVFDLSFLTLCYKTDFHFLHHTSHTTGRPFSFRREISWLKTARFRSELVRSLNT